MLNRNSHGAKRWEREMCDKVAMRLLFVVLASVASCSVPACYSGLIIIPTADVTGSYNWALDLQWQGYSRALRTDQLVVNTEIGIGDRFEMGIDVDATDGEVDHRVLFNAKYVFFKSERYGLATAAGIQNVNAKFTSTPYVAATEEFGATRIHAGVQHEDSSRNNWFVGLDHWINEQWQVMADYTRGKENYLSAGAAWTGKKLQVVAGAQWPNGGGQPVAVLHVVLIGAVRAR